MLRMPEMLLLLGLAHGGRGGGGGLGAKALYETRVGVKLCRNDLLDLAFMQIVSIGDRSGFQAPPATSGASAPQHEISLFTKP